MMPGMPRPRLPNVVIEIDRHGRKRCYHRKGKGKRTPLPLPGAPGHQEAWEAAQRGQAAPTQTSAASGTLAWLIARYKASAHFASLKPSTRAMRDNILKRLEKDAGHVPFRAITRKHVNEGIDRRAPHAGNTFRKVLSGLFKWAVSVEMVAVNPCDGANRHNIKSAGFHKWSVAEVRQFHARWSVGTRERLALDLLLFTGLRRSDVCRIGRQHVQDNVIVIPAQKTGAVAYIPICPALARSIAAAPTGDLLFLATASGRPFASAASFGNWFGKACIAASVPGRAHGLRKAGATIAAEDGATAHELMAMFGWKNLSEAERYTMEADRKRLSAAAAARIANAFVETKSKTRAT